MTKPHDRHLANFEKPTPDFVLLAAGTVALICLGAGLVAALSGGAFGLGALFFVSFLGVLVFFGLYFSRYKRLTAGSRAHRLMWDIDLPESQRSKLNHEVIALAKILEISQEQLSDLLSAYIVAEDLALRQIQQEAGMPILRHVQIGGVPFDGVLVKNDIVTCVEVTFLVTPNVTQEKINQILQKMSLTKKAFEKVMLEAKARLLLILVTQLDEDAMNQLRGSILKKFGKPIVEVDIVFLDFEELQRTYAME